MWPQERREPLWVLERIIAHLKHADLDALKLFLQELDRDPPIGPVAPEKTYRPGYPLSLQPPDLN